MDNEGNGMVYFPVLAAGRTTMASMVAFAQMVSASFQRASELFTAAGHKAAPPERGAGSGYHGPPPIYFQETAAGFGYLVEGLKTIESQLSAMEALIGQSHAAKGILTSAGNDFRAASTAAAGTGFWVNWSGPPASYHKSMSAGFRRLAEALRTMDSQIKAIKPVAETAIKKAGPVPGNDPTFWQRNTATLNNNTFTVPTTVVSQKPRP